MCWFYSAVVGRGVARLNPAVVSRRLHPPCRQADSSFLSVCCACSPSRIPCLLVHSQLLCCKGSPLTTVAFMLSLTSRTINCICICMSACKKIYIYYFHILCLVVTCVPLPAPLCLPCRATGVKGSGIIACMFLARFFIYSAFNALWALCPEM